MTEQKKETHQVELTGVYVSDHDGSAIHTLVPCDNEEVMRHGFGRFDTYVLKRICKFDNLGDSTFEAFVKEKITDHDFPSNEYLFKLREAELNARASDLPTQDNEHQWEYCEVVSKKESIERFRETRKYPKVLKIKLTIETEEVSVEEEEEIWNSFQKKAFDEEIEYRKKELLEKTEQQ